MHFWVVTGLSLPVQLTEVNETVDTAHNSEAEDSTNIRNISNETNCSFSEKSSNNVQVFFVCFCCCFPPHDRFCEKYFSLIHHWSLDTNKSLFANELN